jgi:small subunit ribosomal protein S1
VSEERKSGFGEGGGGPKKPKATFGDVMRGIPAGRGGEREERGGGRDRKGSGEGGSKPADARGGGKPRGGGSDDRKAKGGDAKREEKPKPSGPMVVVRRAAGGITQRPLNAEGTEATGQSASPEEAAETVSPTPVEPVHAVPPTVRSSVADEIPEQESFAELYEAAAKQEGNAGRRVLRVGEKVKAKIFQLGADTAFLSIGGKSEAMIELRELKDAEGILRFGVGDEIEAHVIEAGARGIHLSKTLGKGAASMSMLAEARASGMPVEGLVLAVNKGGLEVAIGDVRAFCPVSQIDLRFVEKTDQFVGEKLKFRVTEIRDRNVVLSRRSILEEEQKALAEQTRKNLDEGKVVRGQVTGVRDFGAFVDLGGVEGLIPVSELSHTRVGHPSEVVKIGDEVEVEILRMEPPNPNSPDKSKQKERITLSLRARQEDPWVAVLAELKEGDRTKGKVVRLQPFGAFVELRPGVDGLIHVSALSNRRIAHPRDVVKVGEEVEVAVEKVDPAEKRIGLRLVKDGEPVGEAGASAAAHAAAEEAGERPAKQASERQPVQSAPRPKVGQVVTGAVDRIEQYGVFVKFPGGKGLVPASETGTDRGTDLRKSFHMGQELKVYVLEIDQTGKIRLSLTAAVREQERKEVEEWKSTQKPVGSGKKGFGTFADLLKPKK